jgi:hypothetical protein
MTAGKAENDREMDTRAGAAPRDTHRRQRDMSRDVTIATVQADTEIANKATTPRRSSVPAESSSVATPRPTFLAQSSVGSERVMSTKSTARTWATSG